MPSADRLISLRLQSEHLRDRREVLQQRHEALLATHHEFDHIRLASKRRALNNLIRGEAIRYKRNGEFWKESNELLERLRRARDGLGADQLKAAQREMAAAAEAAYPAWQQQQERRRIQRIRELEQSEKAVKNRQQQAQEAFIRERDTRSLLMQRLQGVASAEAKVQIDQENQRDENQRQVDTHNALRRRQQQQQDDHKHKQAARKLEKLHQHVETDYSPASLSTSTHTRRSPPHTRRDTQTNQIPSPTLPSPPPNQEQSYNVQSHELATQNQLLQQHSETHVPQHHLHVFKATYDWQTVPLGAWVDPRLEQEIRNGTRRAKIPTTWQTTVDVFLQHNNPATAASAATNTTTVIVEVERHMRLRDLTEGVALAIGRQSLVSDSFGLSFTETVEGDTISRVPPEVHVRVQSNGVSFNEYADVTVEALGSDFYHARPEAEVISISAGAGAATEPSPIKSINQHSHEESSSYSSLNTSSSLSPSSSQSSRRGTSDPSNSHGMRSSPLRSPDVYGGEVFESLAVQLSSPSGNSNNSSSSAVALDTNLSQLTLGEARNNNNMHASEGRLLSDDTNEMSEHSHEYQRRIQSVKNICTMLDLLQDTERLRALRASSNGTVGRDPDETQVQNLVNMAIVLAPDADVGTNSEQLISCAEQSDPDVLCVAVHRALQLTASAILAESLDADNIDDEEEEEEESELAQLLNSNTVQLASTASEAQYVIQTLERACQPPECANILEQVVEHCRILVRNRVVSLNTAAGTYADLLLLLLPADKEDTAVLTTTRPPPLTRLLTSALRCLADPDAQLVVATDSSVVGDGGASGGVYGLAVGGRGDSSDSSENEAEGEEEANGNQQKELTNTNGGCNRLGSPDSFRSTSQQVVSLLFPDSVRNADRGEDMNDIVSESHANTTRHVAADTSTRRLSFDEMLGGSSAEVVAAAAAADTSKGNYSGSDSGGTASRVSSILRRITTAGGDSDDESSLGSGLGFGSGRFGGASTRTGTEAGQQFDLDEDDDEF